MEGLQRKTATETQFDNKSGDFLDGKEIKQPGIEIKFPNCIPCLSLASLSNGYFPIPYSACHSLHVFPKPVPGLAKALSISLNSAVFDLTFESLIVADEASLNAKREERLERHAESAIINTGSKQHS